VHEIHITNGKILKTWITIATFFVALIIGTGLKWNQVDRNEQDIQAIEVKADENEKDIIRFKVRFDNIDDALERIEKRLK